MESNILRPEAFIERSGQHIEGVSGKAFRCLVIESRVGKNERQCASMCADPKERNSGARAMEWETAMVNSR
jgi:hypothetical protein